MNKQSNRSLKYKLLIIMLVNSIITLLCAVFGYQLYTKAYNRLLYNATAGNLSTTASRISEVLERVEQLSYLIISSPVIQTPLSSLDSTTDEITKAEYNRVLGNAIMDYASYSEINGISYIALYNPCFTNATNWAAFHKTSPELLNGARESGAKRQGAVTWTYTSRNPCMLLSRDVRQIKNLSLNPIGELVIGVDIKRVIDDCTRSISMYQNQSFIIADQDNRLIYASESLSDEDAYFFLNGRETAYGKVSYGGHHYFMVSGTLPHYQYRYITFAPFDEISHTLRRSLFTILLTFAAGFLLILFLSNSLIHAVTRQFNALIEKMELFTHNELALPDTDRTSGFQLLETEALHRHFDQMAQRIHRLVQDNYVNEILTKNAQLEALKSQISPHFLYNTLETINWRAKAAGNSTISRMVESLGTLLRASLSTGKPLVTMTYELELVESYMTIQKIRFESRLAYQLSVDPAVSEAMIPPLTIQPLMENAIRYGMEEMTEVCRLYLSAVVEENRLIIQVRNEGSRFDDGLLEHLKDNQAASHGFGIGLLNIEQRIKLLFGSQYGLKLSNEDGFAVAAITLPLQKEEEYYAEINHR